MKAHYKLLNTLVSCLCLLVLASCTSTGNKRSADENRKLSENYVKMGVRYMEFGKLSVALEKLERAIDIDDNNANAHNSIAVFYERIRNYSEAENHFQEALSLEPEDPSVLNNYGRFLCDNGGDPEQGIAYLVKSSELPFNNRPWFALTNVGQCYFKQGNSQQAEPYFRAALLRNPEYPPALLNMAEISYEKSEYMKTRAFLERFLNYHQATASCLLLGFLAEQALDRGDQKAAEYKSQLLTEFPLSEQAKKVRQMQGMISEQKKIPSRLINSTLEPVISIDDTNEVPAPGVDSISDDEIISVQPEPEISSESDAEFEQ